MESTIKKRKLLHYELSYLEPYVAEDEKEEGWFLRLTGKDKENNDAVLKFFFDNLTDAVYYEQIVSKAENFSNHHMYTKWMKTLDSSSKTFLHDVHAFFNDNNNSSHLPIHSYTMLHTYLSKDGKMYKQRVLVVSAIFNDWI